MAGKCYKWNVSIVMVSDRFVTAGDGVRLTMSDRFVSAGHTAPRLKPVPDKKGWLSPKFKMYVHCTNVVVHKTHWQKSKVKKSKLVSHQQKKNFQISKLKEASQA